MRTRRKRKPVQVQVNAGMTNLKPVWRNFVRICHANNRTAAGVLREYILATCRTGYLIR